jgi:uncharacterized protein with WD repeat
VGVEWSPDGRFLLTSVLHERVKMENEFKIFTATGQMVSHVKLHD